MTSETVYWGQRALAEISSIGTGLANVAGSAGQTSLNVTGNIYSSNSVTTGNLITNNIIMSSNMSSGTGLGNVYFSGNLVVTGNIFSSGGSVGSGSGTSQGILFSLGAGGYTLPGAFSTGTAGPGISGYHVNLASFVQEAAQAVTQFGAGTGLLKFTTAGLYQVTCVIVGDQPVAKVAIGKTASLTSWTALQASGQGATTGYDYVYNYPVGSSPSEIVTLPVTVTDISQYYYLDVFFSTVVAAPTTLYPTRSTTAAGSNFGTYVQVAPFGNHLTSATGVAAALLANCSSSSILSGVYSSNTYRITLTSANGWTVNGVSTSLAVTANGNFQVNQTGIYEVNLCLNTVGQTACQFRVGSLASDSLAPGGTTPAYLYSYSPMYTQDPTTAIQLPLNITNVANVYFVECSFPGTLTGSVALEQASTFVSIKPIGGYINSATNPWVQQGTSVYYNDGPVGIGGVNPSALTETLTVNGTTAFVGNVTVTSDASGSTYVLGKRVPAGSLDVTQYVTGSVPLTTTTNLIQKYLSNAATIVSTAPTYNPALSLSNTAGTTCNLTAYHSTHYNLATSNLFLEAWIYVSTLPNNPGIFEITDGTNADMGLFISAANGLQGYVSNTTGTTTSSSFTTAISTLTWTHIAMSWNYVTQKIFTFKNGVRGGPSGTMNGTPRFTEGKSVYLGDRSTVAVSNQLNGYIYDMRVIRGSTVPDSSFTAPATPAVFSQTTLPSYTGLSALTGNTIALALQTSYFPGASTSPYGPCLTLPGTVGSYYNAGVNSAFNTNWSTSGFTVEAWVNYASLANSGTFPVTISHMQPTAGNIDWGLGTSVTGQIVFYYNGNGATSFVRSGANALITGQWTHIVVQCNALRIFLFVNGIQRTDLTTSYTNAGTGSAASIVTPIGLDTTSTPLCMGQYNNLTGPNFAIAKARLVFGTSGANGNVYSSGNFTPNPNFNPTLPSGATVAWSLESKYPLPTYPSFFDVPVLPQQTPAYGAEPTPIGGVTSNVLSPYPTTYPQLDSIRFDGTGYIDYGNAASSVLCSNLWASPWTIEGWVYTPSFSTFQPILFRSQPGSGPGYYDIGLFINQTSGTIQFACGNLSGSGSGVTGSALALNTWTHIAVTWDGVRSNIYQGTSGTSSTVASNPVTSSFTTFNPTFPTHIGTWQAGSPAYLSGNLADVRVSNVARYTGSSYTVPSAPFTTDSSTLLLLKSLGGQVGTTLEVQGRGLNAVSLGATQTVRAYPPAPMSSYLLDTTSNASVTYGQGKYVASSSSENSTYSGIWSAFDKVYSMSIKWISNGTYSTTPPYSYTGSVGTVDTLGNSYAGEWVQLQMPVSIILSSVNYSFYIDSNYESTKLWVLGSRDGINWTLVATQVGISSLSVTINVSTTQAYNYYRIVLGPLYGTGGLASASEIIFYGTEESLCVTSDAKVGVGIANPQRALEVAGDLIVGGTISGGAGMGGFRNRIINGDMRIAQRGVGPAAVTFGGAQFYQLDRFGILSATVTGGLQQAQQTLVASDTPYQLGFRNSWRVTVTSALTYNYIQPNHVVEGYNIADLQWGTSFGSPVTISFWFRANHPTGSLLGVTLRNLNSNPSYVAPFTVTNSGVWQFVSFTVPPPPNGGTWYIDNNSGIVITFCGYQTTGLSPVVNSWTAANYVGQAGGYNWFANAGNYIEFTGVQLERGTVATPFEFRPFATELALCQRYFYVPNAALSVSMVFGTGYAGGTTTAYINIPHPVTMRASPTAISNSAVGTFQIGYIGTATPVTAIAAGALGPYNSALTITTAAVLTGGQGVNMTAVSTSAFLGFNAEL